LKENLDSNSSIEQRIRRVESDCKKCVMLNENLEKELSAKNMKSLEELFEKFKEEETRFDKVRSLIYMIPKIQQKSELALAKISEMETQINRSTMEAYFVERSLPLMVHF
jgi:hypothetical protein